MTVDRRGVLEGMAVSLMTLGPARATELAGKTPDPAGKTPEVLEARTALVTIGTRKGVEVWGYGGAVPGPVLRLRRGERLDVRLVNKLARPTTLCWHGVRGPNAMDGVGGLTQAPVAPGAAFDYRFEPPDAGLFWFHPHVTPDSLEQMTRGLAGVLIVDEPEPPKVDDDLLLVLQDWVVEPDGKLAVRPPAQGASLATVNGGALPLGVTQRAGSRVRLRLLNACTSTILEVSFEGLEATVIAIDGQPSEIFQPMHGMIPIGPGARFELMVDLPREPGKTAKLRLRRGASPVEDLLVITTGGEPVPAHAAVAKLPENAALPTRIHLERALKRKLAIATTAPTGWSLGGSTGATTKQPPLFEVKRGEPVSLALVNETDEPQQIHLHGHVFRVLHDLDDGWDPYWRDSLLMGPRKTKHIAFVADNPGRWAIESAMIERQVAGLAGWFEVR